MNQVTLIGNLTNDLELKEARETGKVYTQFTLAVNNYNGKEKYTDFVEIVAFGQKAQTLTTYMHKGRKIFIIGKLKNNTFTNQEGVKRHTTKVILEDFEFVDNKKKE